MISHFVSNIRLPVLPQGLHIMADQGFRHQDPVIVLPRANQPAISADMRRYVMSYSNLQKIKSRVYHVIDNLF